MNNLLKAPKKLTEALKNLKWTNPNGYIKFSYLAGINRAIIPSQVTKLAISVEKMGAIRPIVIAEISFINGKKEKYIIDGQHLFNALIRLDIPIPYVTIEINDKKELVETIAMLNASSKTWTMQDYVTAWSSLKDDYIKLNHYFQVYDLEVAEIAAILMGNLRSSGQTVKSIKAGSFKIVNETKNVEILDNITDMLKTIPRMNRFENRYAIKEYVKFLRSTNKYNHAKFLSGLARNKKKFILATQEEGKLSDLFRKISI